MPTLDERFIQKTFDLARAAVAQGNQPFGACLARGEELLLVAENSIYTGSDMTRHAERMLASLASQRLERPVLSSTTLYTSTEPCAMCAGAIFWAGISRVVYGCSQEAFAAIAGKALDIPCRDVLAYSQRPIEVLGPVLEAEALAIHQAYWPQRQDAR